MFKKYTFTSLYKGRVGTITFSYNNGKYCLRNDFSSVSTNCLRIISIHKTKLVHYNPTLFDLT